MHNFVKLSCSGSWVIVEKNWWNQ